MDNIGSGNFLVDFMEAEMDRLERESKFLDCGCPKPRCTCDDAWDRRDE